MLRPFVVWAFSLLLAVLPGWVGAAPGWQARLLQPGADQPATPRPVIRIELPADLPAETIAWLALELDATDVSALVKLEGRVVAVTPPTPLQAGEHRVRLVQYAPDGSSVVRGAWRFQVGTPTQRRVAVQANVTANPTYRFDEGDIEAAALPGRLQGTATAQFAGQGSGPGWQVTGRMDLLYNSLPQLPGEQSGDGAGGQAAAQTSADAPLHEFELGEFLFTGQRGVGFINLGQHAVGPDSLIMQQFARRGLSAGTRSRDNRFYGTGFILRTEPVVGWRTGLGISDPDHRVTGAVFSARPFRRQPDRLTLSAAYLQGQGQDQAGAGVSGEPTVGRGDAWSLAADSLLLKGRLRLRGEYAQTRFDFDGPNQGFGKERDQATALLAVFQPWANKPVQGKPLNVQFGAEYKKIGTFFRSLANPGLPSDKELTRVFANANWGGLNLQVSAGREDDNVNDVATLPRLRKELVMLAGSYTPQAAAQAQAGKKKRGFWRRLFGTPTYTVNVQTVRDETLYTPAGYQGAAVDGHSRQAQVGATFAHQRWSWFTSYYTAWQDDATGAQPDTRNDMASLGVNLQPNDRVNLGIQLQRNVANDLDSGLDNTTWLAAANTTVTFIPDKLTGTLSYSNSREEASDRSTDRVVETTDLTLTWQVQAARGQRPGVALWLQGQYQDTDDRVDPAQNTSPFQVFLGATVSWSGAYQRAY